MTDATRTRSRERHKLAPGYPALGQPPLRRALARTSFYRRLLLVVGDVAAVLIWVGLLASVTGRAPTLPVWFAGAGLVPLVAKLAGLYAREPLVLNHATLDEVPRIAAVAAVVVLALGASLGVSSGAPGLAAGAALVASVAVARLAVRRAGRALTAPERVLVVGDGPAYALLKRKVNGDPRLNVALVGRLGRESEPRAIADRRLGAPNDLEAVALTRHIDRVVLAPGELAAGELDDLLRRAHALGVRISLLAPVPAAAGSAAVTDDLGGQVLIGLREFGIGPCGRVAKRLFDVALAGALLILLAPLMGLIALAIKCSSRGPVLFRQIRVGKDGRRFEIFKFRTMFEGADELKPLLSALNQAAPLFKIANDPRTTPVGRLLRRYSLDELPQLFNVLRGEMSLVGPRPLICEEDRLFNGWQRSRYAVAPGITGPWQILGSSRVPLSDMVAIDYLYCANWSLWQDLKILLRTLRYVLSRQSGEHIGTRR
ncbi:exopolysaccharide biosynthesis polyprenyl glycosylphosphotransferase [Thermoleophilum album]|uniref:Exopolysaccharide biosynthesis polyprenyl glycosylphosphotransferase n=1 Tax=Thermoleophilum album TaxID=29539 RepID=A0A1H6FHG2_THEAL|nr:exopolysaccharide biosynthesis polyprenyl glycosylphosphotransferase [Thermoleophilum album]SEH10289.1 exopolysaccharide biosynthesis polyprenyl glycosylphosphotransferase [Thermoleophilum album]